MQAPDQNGESPLDQLAARHEAILLRLVEGMTPGEVCAEFGLTPSRLSVLRGSDIWREAESRLRRERRGDARLRLENLRDRAIDALSDTVAPLYRNSGIMTPPTIRLQSAREILAQTGFGTEFGEESRKVVFQLYIPPGWRSPVELAVETNGQHPSND